MSANRADLLALADAGYMPVSEYVKRFKDEPRKDEMIDYDKTINDLDGKPLTDSTTDPAVEVTLGKVSSNALLMPFSDEQNLLGDEKVKRFMIAVKIWEKKEDLTAEEISVVKKCIGKAYPPLVVGRAWAMLDPASMK